ncbi:MAG: helix-hairpin-helix domain-containing protein [Candidatus Marinimicrobia bacterium]|nr:helix-hairpin-helix domain-containing protein [Candidatus Neomarinimicrobiota bacterium]
MNLLKLTKQERLVIYLLVILLLVGGIIRVIRYRIFEGVDYSSQILEFRRKSMQIGSNMSDDSSDTDIIMEKININTAGIEELKKIPNVGEVIALRIIEYREKVGKFDSVEQLLEIKGIGEKTLSKIRGVVTIE